MGKRKKIGLAGSCPIAYLDIPYRFNLNLFILLYFLSVLLLSTRVASTVHNPRLSDVLDTNTVYQFVRCAQPTAISMRYKMKRRLQCALMVQGLIEASGWDVSSILL